MKLKITLLLLIVAFTAYSQSWQWGKRGGSTDVINPGATIPEQVRSMTTDAQGNVYLLSPVGVSDLNVDGHVKTGYSGYAAGSLTDYMISSFSCDGAYRWSKVLGGQYNDEFKTIQTDNLGHVYVAGKLVAPQVVSDNTIHFDTDSIIPFSGYNNEFKQSLFLIQYDTDGNLQWIRTPQPSNLTWANAYSSYASHDLQVDAQGNSYWLCLIPAGTFANGAYVNTQPGLTFHILKYDVSGNFIGAFPFNFTMNYLIGFKVVRNHNTGAFYIAGYRTSDDTITINGEAVTHSMFVAAFDSQGAFLWKRENTKLSGAQLHDFVLDTDGNLYITGGTQNDSFNGNPMTGTTPYESPFLMKLAPNGDTIWQTNASNSSQIHGKAVMVNATEVIITGMYSSITWQNQTFQLPLNTGSDAYLMRFSKATGTLLGFVPIPSNSGPLDEGTALTGDSLGNVYVGGRFGGQVTVGTTTLINAGQESDFFVAKYGSSNCTLAVEEQETQQLKVYPNPAKDKVQIETTEDLQYTIYNVMGSVVAQGHVTVQDNTIGIGTLASGCYVMQFQNDKGEFRNLKLIKE